MSSFASPDEPRPDAATPTPADADDTPVFGTGLPVADAASADAVFGTPEPTEVDASDLTVPPAIAPVKVARPLSGRAIAGIAAGSLLLGLGGGVGGAAAWSAWGPDDDNSYATLPVAEGGTVEVAQGSVAAVAQAVLPSVVQIEALSDGNPEATGSGFVIRKDGYILTNNHVVEGADKTVHVLFSDGHQEDGTVVGTSPEYDLAVVKVDSNNLTPLVLGDSDASVVGDPVIAIGSPLGLDSTVTTGIVSALDRPVTTVQTDTTAYIAAIQTDAAINPGNSGGPLINAKGEVIGINSAIAALPGATQQTGAGSVGLGFAIPSNEARRIAEELIKDGKAEVPVIGAQLDKTYSGRGVRIADQSQLPDDVVPIVPNSPAQEAGLKAGDIIVKVDGAPVADPASMIVRIRAHAPGDQLTITVERDDKDVDLTMTLQSRDDLDTGK